MTGIAIVARAATTGADPTGSVAVIATVARAATTVADPEATRDPIGARAATIAASRIEALDPTPRRARP